MRYIILDLNDRNINVSNLITKGYVIYALDEVSATSIPFSDVDTTPVYICKNKIPLDLVGNISKKLQTTKKPSSPDLSTFDFSLNDFDLQQAMDVLGVRITDCFVNVCLNTNTEVSTETTLIRLFFSLDIYRFSIYKTRLETNILKIHCDTSRLYRTLPDVVTNPYNFRAVRASKVTAPSLRFGQIEQRSKTGSLITNQFRASAVVDPAKGWARPAREPIQFDGTVYFGWVPNLGNYNLDGSYWDTLRTSPYTSADVGFWLEIEDPDLQTSGPLFDGDTPLKDLIGSKYLVTFLDDSKYTAEFIGSTLGFWKGLSTGIVPKTIGRGWYYFFKLDDLSKVKFRQATADDWKKSPFSYKNNMSLGSEQILFELPKGFSPDISDANVVFKDGNGNELNKDDFTIFETADKTGKYLSTSPTSQGILKYSRWIPEFVDSTEIGPKRTKTNQLLTEIEFSQITNDDIRDSQILSILPQNEPTKFVSRKYCRDIVMKIPQDLKNILNTVSDSTFVILTRFQLCSSLYASQDFSGRGYFWFADKFFQPVGESIKYGLVDFPQATPANTQITMQNINVDFPSGLTDPNNLLRFGSPIVEDLEIEGKTLNEESVEYVVFTFEQDEINKDRATDHYLNIAFINFANKTELSYGDLTDIYISRYVSDEVQNVPETIFSWGGGSPRIEVTWAQPDPYCERTSYEVPSVDSEFDFKTDGYIKDGNTFNNFEFLANQSPYTVDIRTRQTGFPDGSDTRQALVFIWNYAWRDVNLTTKSSPAILNAYYDDSPDDDLPTELNISWIDRFGKEQSLELFNSPSFQTLITSASEIKKTIKSSVEIFSEEPNNWIDLIYPELIANFNKTRKVVKRDYKFPSIDFGDATNQEIIYTIMRFINKSFGTGELSLTVPYTRNLLLGDHISNIKHPHIKFGKYVADGFLGEITIDVQSMLMQLKVHNINLLYDSAEAPTLSFLDTSFSDLLIQEDLSNTEALINGVM